MSRRVLILGQSPGKIRRPLGALSNASGEKIAEMAGIDFADFLRFERVNLLTEFPGSASKGEFFPASQARAAAKGIRFGGRKVLVVGLAVARAVGANPKPLSVTFRERCEFWVIPHTSGIVLWWNDLENALSAERFLRRFFHGRS